MSGLDPSVAPVLVLFGGSDAEAPVSRDSGRAVVDALADAGRRVAAVDLPHGDDETVGDALAAHPDAIVFPVLHGPWGEGGPLQDILVAAGRRFVGADPEAARCCMDKQRTKDAAAAAGVPVIEGGVVGPGDPSPVPPPAVVKPVDDGSSVDLIVAGDGAALLDAIDRITARRGRALVERLVRGREITVALLDGEPLPVVEIIPADGTYDYAAKYERADTRYRTDPPDLPPAVAAAAAASARLVWDAVGARDLARADFMVDGDTPRLLEVNTMPGFTSRSLFPRAAHAGGYDLPRLVSVLVDRAAAREPLRGPAASVRP